MLWVVNICKLLFSLIDQSEAVCYRLAPAACRFFSQAACLRSLACLPTSGCLQAPWLPSSGCLLYFGLLTPPRPAAYRVFGRFPLFVSVHQNISFRDLFVCLFLFFVPSPSVLTSVSENLVVCVLDQA